ncbi:MAG: ABC transporter permease [candidate division WS1 bacterium]|jgi:ABC-type lipoprotein release transport system permease subunit|nr:ABC transporter permease [candidate division WS1 bacterium]
MNVLRLSLQEIAHRKLSFGLGLLSVMIAVGVLVGAVTMLGGHDLRTEQLVAQKEAETREEMTRMEDDYRRIMKDMGYNVLILHKDQSLEELQRLNYPTHYMPEDWAQQLADQNVETLNHLLPLLQEMVSWPEMKREVLLTGVRGQIPFADSPKNRRPPIMQPVEQGEIKLGADLAQSLDVAEGDTVTMRGRNLLVREVYARRGTQDDLTAWVSLRQAQEWMNRPGQINGILALECLCNVEELGSIEYHVTRILPDAQVYEFSSLIAARGLARQRAAEAHEKAIEQEMYYRASLREERRAFAGILVPVSALGAAAWVMFLMMANVRERRAEIGVLRAIGVSARRVQSAFLLKALLMGVFGGIVGLVVGSVAGAWLSEVPPGSEGFTSLLNARLLVGALVGAPLLAALASWLPARAAARQDPALVLQEE